MEGMSAVSFVFGVFGLVAFVRLEKLTRELKAKGILENDYEENCPPMRNAGADGRIEVTRNTRAPEQGARFIPVTAEPR